MACSNMFSGGRDSASLARSSRNQLGSFCRALPNGRSLFSVRGQCRHCGSCLSRCGVITSDDERFSATLAAISGRGVESGQQFGLPGICRACGQSLQNGGCNSCVATDPLVSESSVSSPSPRVEAPPKANAVRECCDSVDGCGLYLESDRNSFWPSFTRPRWVTCSQLYGGRVARENQFQDPQPYRETPADNGDPPATRFRAWNGFK